MRAARMHIDVPTGSLDPAKATDYMAEYVGAALFPPLIRAGARGLAPGLVSRVETSPDGRVLLHLSEAMWSDGRPLLSEDVRQTWMRVESGRGTGVALLRLLLGDESVADAVRCPDSRSLAVQLRPGGRAFLRCLSAMSLSPVRPDAVGAVALGPYRLLDPGSSTHGPRLARNPACPGGADAVEEIAFDMVRDPDESLDAWLAGDCEVTCTTMFPSRRVGHPDVVPHLSVGETMLRGVITLAPTWSARTGISARQLSPLVPRGDVVDVLAGCVTPEAGFWPSDPGGSGARPLDERPVRRHPGSRHVLRLAVADFHPNLEVCHAISKGWRAAGVEVDITVVDYAKLGAARETYDAVYQILGPAYPDKEAHLLSMQLGSSGASAAVQRARLVTVAGTASSQDLRLLSDHLHQHPPYIPILKVQSRAAVSPDLAGFRLDEHGLPDFAALSWRRPARGRKQPVPISRQRLES